MKFCIICGGLLFQNSDGMECSTCGRIYSGILISESTEEDEDFVTTELSVSIESIIMRELKSPERLEAQVEIPREKEEVLPEDWKKQRVVIAEALV
ncbi:MAG: hypothetical protein HY930_00140 [Euryarchaeota archaeon]|nr:hypothetical protein [Euryarchaeota archaeon]